MLDTVLSSFNGTGVTTDASLNSGGMEFQTPILKGKYGEKYMKDFSAKLIANKFFIDKRCGLHIHLDGDQFTLESIAKNSQNVLKKVSWFFNCGKSTQGYKNGIQELRKYSRYNDGGNYRDWYPDAKNVKDMTTNTVRTIWL